MPAALAEYSLFLGQKSQLVLLRVGFCIEWAIILYALTFEVKPVGLLSPFFLSNFRENIEYC
jgi:hypothetical protein